MANKKSTRNEPEPKAGTVALVSPDQQFVEETAAPAIKNFLAGVGQFFLVASGLEREAIALRKTAEALPKPKTVDEDVERQELVKNAAGKIKTAEQHWNPITSAISQFHKRMTGRRSITIEALEAVRVIGNNHHNEFKQDAERAAARENDRIRREAEDKARADQEIEAARLEAEAMKLEEASADLSEREQLFVERYALPGPMMGNAIGAARSVGYAKPDNSAAQLLSRPKILNAIKAKQSAVAMTRQATAVRQQPVDVGAVQTVTANVRRAVGTSSRTTWTAEVFDEAKFVAAVAGGQHGIDLGVLTYKQADANALAVKLHEALDQVPGIRAVKKTGVV